MMLILKIRCSYTQKISEYMSMIHYFFLLPHIHLWNTFLSITTLTTLSCVGGIGIESRPSVCSLYPVPVGYQWYMPICYQRSYLSLVDHFMSFLFIFILKNIFCNIQWLFYTKLSIREIPRSKHSFENQVFLLL